MWELQAELGDLRDLAGLREVPAGERVQLVDPLAAVERRDRLVVDAIGQGHIDRDRTRRPAVVAVTVTFAWPGCV